MVGIFNLRKGDVELEEPDLELVSQLDAPNAWLVYEAGQIVEINAAGQPVLSLSLIHI